MVTSPVYRCIFITQQPTPAYLEGELLGSRRFNFIKIIKSAKIVLRS